MSDIKGRKPDFIIIDSMIADERHEFRQEYFGKFVDYTTSAPPKTTAEKLTGLTPGEVAKKMRELVAKALKSDRIAGDLAIYDEDFAGAQLERMMAKKRKVVTLESGAMKSDGFLQVLGRAERTPDAKNKIPVSIAPVKNDNFKLPPYFRFEYMKR